MVTTEKTGTRPGSKAGQSNEFTLISKLKPGGAERVRKLLADGFTGERQKNTDRIATVHDLRFVIFDDDTRIIFASTFDGDWESYINDFATILPDEIDLLFNEFDRVGGAHPIPIDVRVIAATNGDLRAAVDAGTFRLDLFYRLNVFPIQIPSLRERPDDIPLLAKYFIERYARNAGKKVRSIERKTLEWLQAYDWPGNIRELQNVVERAVILCDCETFAIDETWLRPERRGTTKRPVPLTATIVNQERVMIEAALEESRGRISGPSGAAGKLGMPRTTLESKIKSLRINKHRFACA